MNDICPKCQQKTWKFNIYLHATAPARMYGQLSKRNIAKKDFQVQAALWETTSFFCVNPKCMYNTKPARQVRMDAP